MFFTRYYPIIRRTAFLATKDISSAEEYLVELLYHIYKRNITCEINSIQESDILPWLLSSLLDIIKQKKYSHKTDYSQELARKKISHKENLKQVLILQFLLQLDSKVKLSIFFLYYENLNYFELSQIIGYDQNTLKETIEKGLDNIKMQLKNCGIFLTTDLLIREIKRLNLPEFTETIKEKISSNYLNSLSIKKTTISQKTQKHLHLIIITTLLIPLFFGVLFLLDELKSTPPESKEPIQEPVVTTISKEPENIEPIKLIPIKNSWNFKLDTAEEFKVLKGTWVRNMEEGYMKTEYNKTTLILTPFLLDSSKAIVVFIKGFIFSPQLKEPVLSRICGYLVHGKFTVENTFKNIKNINTTKKIKTSHGISIPIEYRILIQQKGIFVFDDNYKLVNAMYFKEPAPNQCNFVLSLDNIYINLINLETSPIPISGYEQIELNEPNKSTKKIINDKPYHKNSTP